MTKGPTPKQLGILWAIGEGLAKLRKQADELAPELAKAYEQATKDGYTFVDWLRMGDHTIPLFRTLYREHPVYRGADFVRRRMAAPANRKAAAKDIRFLIRSLQDELQELTGKRR